MWFVEVKWTGPNTAHGYVGRITVDGALTEFDIPTDNAYPIGIAPGPDGNLWFTESSGSKIGRITPTGVITEFPLPQLDLKPSGIAAGPDGHMWFTEYNNSHVGRITMDGTITLFSTPTPFSGPQNIAAGPDGDMWFTETSAVGRVTPDGTISEFPVSTNWYVMDIAGHRGTVFFTEPGTGELGRAWMSGRIAEHRVPGAIEPWGLAVGPHGAIWISEGNAPRLAIIPNS
jgi:virginiamycin B lyase